jgi:hypothetical protein
MPYAARYQTCRPGISHSLQRVHQLVNAAANPVNDKLNFGNINSGQSIFTHLGSVHW